MEKDARVAIRARGLWCSGKIVASEAPEEYVGTLHEPFKVEMEISEERPLIVGALSEQEGATVEPPLTLAETGPESFPRLEVEGAAASPPAEDVARVSDPAGSPGTGVGPQVLTSGRPTPSSTFGLSLHRGDKKAFLGYGDFLAGLRSSKCFS